MEYEKHKKNQGSKWDDILEIVTSCPLSNSVTGNHRDNSYSSQTYNIT